MVELFGPSGTACPNTSDTLAISSSSPHSSSSDRSPSSSLIITTQVPLDSGGRDFGTAAAPGRRPYYLGDSYRPEPEPLSDSKDSQRVGSHPITFMGRQNRNESHGHRAYSSSTRRDEQSRCLEDIRRAIGPDVMIRELSTHWQLMLEDARNDEERREIFGMGKAELIIDLIFRASSQK